MRLSLVTTAVCGTVAVSALTLPNHDKRLKLDLLGIDIEIDLVDLSAFEETTFTLLDPEAAKAAAEAANFSEGPDDSSLTNAAGNEGNANSTLFSGTCKTPHVRYEWRDLTDEHKAEFVDAIGCLMRRPSNGNFNGSQSRWEDLVALHQEKTPTIHMVAQFLPWHRYYLHVAESMMRSECGFTGPFPWWDETKDAGRFSEAPMFTDEYFGSAHVKTEGRGTCVTDGAFASTTLHVGPGSNNTDHCLSRALDEELTKNCNQDFVDMCNSHNRFSDMESCAQMGPHAYGHNGLGAVMADVAAAPGDPIFFLHHAFVDHNWRIWQNANNRDRLYQINGFSTIPEPRQNLTLDDVLSSNGLRPDVKVRDVMNTVGGYLCYKYNY